MIKKRWLVKSGDTTQENRLVNDLGVTPVVAKLLVNRGFDSISGQQFLYGSMDSLLDPFTLKGMIEGVALIEDILEQHKPIVIYGDYDVDGITATSLLYRFFSRLGANVSYYIPERQGEGYGLNLEALEHLIEQGTALIITVDCGISSYDIVEQVKDRVHMVITDHHNAPDQIPNADAVINHKQPGCLYEDKNLSGVGVAFKLAQAIWLRKTGEWYREDLDIVALGTVADVVPLVGENRIVVQAGLAKMVENPNIGINALISVAGLTGKQITAGHIGYTLAPRLNAAGRVSHATRAVELLVTTNAEEALDIADELQATNVERQELERHIHEMARQDVINQGHKADHIIVVGGEGWHPGVIGIVASRLVEEFYKPTMVLSIHDGVGKGSCRSIEGFNVYEALKFCEDLLLQFGGHAAAAGFSIDAAHIDELRERLDGYCRKQLTTEDYVPIVNIDTTLPVNDIDVEIIDNIAALEPYGMGNSTPVFAVTSAEVQDVILMGQLKKHCKVILKTAQGSIDAIAWNRPDLFKQIFAEDMVKVAFSLQKNEWQGYVSPQLMIQDIELLGEQHIVLTTEGLREMYLVVKQIARGGRLSQYQMEQEVLRRHPKNQNHASAMMALQVFKELGIILEDENDDGLPMYRWNQVQGKLDLVTSITFLTYSKQEVSP